MRLRGRVCLGAACLPLLAAACAAPPLAPPPTDSPRWDFFGEASDDTWARKVGDWQARQQADGSSLGERRDPPRQPAKYAPLLDHGDAFLARERRALAARVLEHSQRRARYHYKGDPETDLAGDPWPTSRELYARDGDDCDGLDLIAYDLLRALGFPPEQLFRVVVRRDRDGAYHMATLWFEDAKDPWVIDATGTISPRLERFSQLQGWTPVRLFDEDEFYAATPADAPPAAPRPEVQGRIE